jgi:hypothetical protein
MLEEIRDVNAFHVLINVKVPCQCHDHVCLLRHVCLHHCCNVSAVYVTVLWALGGYLNTCSYMVAPTCVVPTQKANAAGLMAITSQISHCVGLFLAVVLATVLFGGVIDV